jgi:hypothetical protein
MGNLIAGIVEFLIGMYCAIQQMNTTHDSVVSALQGGTLISSHLTGPELLTVLNTSMDKFNKIGWAVAWVTQTVFVTTIMPASPITRMGFHKILVVVFFICEIITDIWYAIATSTTLGGVFTFIFTFGASGLAGSIVYVLAMTTGSIFLLTDGIHRLEVSIKVLMSQHKQAESAAVKKA